MAGAVVLLVSGSAATEKRVQESGEIEVGCSYKREVKKLRGGVAWHCYKLATIRRRPRVPALAAAEASVVGAARGGRRQAEGVGPADQ